MVASVLKLVFSLCTLTNFTCCTHQSVLMMLCLSICEVGQCCSMSAKAPAVSVLAMGLKSCKHVQTMMSATDKALQQQVVTQKQWQQWLPGKHCFGMEGMIRERQYSWNAGHQSKMLSLRVLVRGSPHASVQSCAPGLAPGGRSEGSSQCHT